MKNNSRRLHLFKGLLRLVPSEFESKLSKLNNNNSLLSEKGWSPEAIENGIFIDLSQVRWTELSAVGQLVLLIESAKSSSIHVTVAFPLNDLTKKEKEHLEQIKLSNQTEYNKLLSLFHNIKVLRQKTLDYLRTLRFDSVIDCNHIKTGKISKIYDYSSDFESNVSSNNSENDTIISSDQFDENSKNETDYNYQLIIPFTWINSSNQATNLERFNELFNRIISQPHRGLDAVDAEAINNVIISELTKNVFEHSDREFGLIGVVLQPTSALARTKTDGDLSFTDFNKIEQNYVEWASRSNDFYVAIFFGDSGNGLVEKLKGAYEAHTKKNNTKPEETLRWSFDKWSTGKDELVVGQTKGLYRIHRIVNKYNGIILIRTQNIFGGFQKGGLEASTWVYSDKHATGKELSFIPGTILKMQFTPYREILKINTQQTITFGNENPKFEWISKSIKLDEENSPENTFSGEFSLKEIFSNNNKNLLLIINATKNHKSNKASIDDSILDYLKFLSLGRHPNGVLIYIAYKYWDVIDTRLDSLNQLIFDHKIQPNSEALHPDKEDIYDPILVIGEGGQFKWVGDNQNTISVLDELYAERSKQKKLMELDSFLKLDESEQTKILQFVSNDNAIISLTNEQHLRINFEDVVLYYADLLRKKIKEERASGNSKRICLTPNLRYINKWIEVNRIISNDLAGYALALFFEYSRNIENHKEFESGLKILIDNADDRELANQLAIIFGVPSSNVINIVDEIDGRLPRRNRIFEKNDKVIILTTIISTAETVRRSIKHIQRDLAKPIVILGLVNQLPKPIVIPGLVNQSDDLEIKTWGEDVPIITLIKDEIKDIPEEVILKHKKNGTIDYRPPFALKPNGDGLIDEEGTNAEIFNLIETTKSLHFNHLGKANGRHFTFYLSPSSMLSDEIKSKELVADKFQAILDSWLDKNGINDFEIWQPTLDFKVNDPLDWISDSLSKNHQTKSKQSKNTYKPLRISKIKRTSLFGEWSLIDDSNLDSSNNVMILDWGTLTGSTIQQMINLAIKHEKTNILVCVLFSQFSRQEANFFSNLNQVKILKKVKKSLSEEELPLFEEEEKEEKPASISVNFIYNLPLNYYESFTCPVCEHIKALFEFEIKDNPIGNFSLKRRERLKIKDKSIADGPLPPQDFYYDYEGQLSELDSTLIMKMFKFRILLQEAIESTKKRNEIYEYLVSVLNNIETHKAQANSDLYAILYFLSIEIMWLQKPPLVFLKLRKIISELALKVAIWDRELMEKQFGNKTNLVVRYKSSAVSVLRSSDKLAFCEHIYEIFIGAKKGEKYSYTIRQNLFYHTHSLLLKEYHKSKKYFSVTIENLQKTSNAENVTTETRYVAEYLMNLAIKKKYLIALEGKSKIELVKSLKKEIKDYYGIIDHSEIFEFFRSMSIANVDEAIKRLDINSNDDSLELRQIEEWANSLAKRWSRVSGYIGAVVNNHLLKLSEFYESNLFMNFRMHELFPVDENSALIGYNDEFTKIINLILKNPFEIKIYRESYIEHYNRLFIGVFLSRNLNHSNDSKIKSLLNELPTNLNNNIEKRIKTLSNKFTSHPRIIFNKFPDINVFYPKQDFEFALDQILSNVVLHKNKEIRIEGIEITLTIKKTIDIKSDREIVILEIFNTGTVDDEKKENGALSKIKKELNIFGGDCVWDFKENSLVTLTFLNYGE